MELSELLHIGVRIVYIGTCRVFPSWISRGFPSCTPLSGAPRPAWPPSACCRRSRRAWCCPSPGTGSGFSTRNRATRATVWIWRTAGPRPRPFRRSSAVCGWATAGRWWTRRLTGWPGPGLWTYGARGSWVQTRIINGIPKISFFFFFFTYIIIIYIFT